MLAVTGDIVVAMFGVGGTMVVVIGGLIVALVRTRPDWLQAETSRINNMSDRLTHLEAKVERLERQAVIDEDERHDLKGTLAYIVGVARQAVRAILSVFTDEEIDGLPAPLKKHVRSNDDFAEQLEMTRRR